MKLTFLGISSFEYCICIIDRSVANLPSSISPLSYSSAIWDSPLCYHLLTVHRRFFRPCQGGLKLPHPPYRRVLGLPIGFWVVFALKSRGATFHRGPGSWTLLQKTNTRYALNFDPFFSMDIHIINELSFLNKAAFLYAHRLYLILHVHLSVCLHVEWFLTLEHACIEKN